MFALNRKLYDTTTKLRLLTIVLCAIRTTLHYFDSEQQLRSQMSCIRLVCMKKDVQRIAMRNLLFPVGVALRVVSYNNY